MTIARRGTPEVDDTNGIQSARSIRARVACGAALMAIATAACASAPSTPDASPTGAPSPTTNVTLVHDIPSDHPRIPYFEEFAASVNALSANDLAVDINPQGKVLAGRASLDAVRSGEANLALVNMSHLEAIEPAAGFMNLPFALDDTTMASDQNRAAVSEVQADLVRPHGIELLGYMRGADQLFAFPQNDVDRLEELEGKKIRVAGSGIYEQIMRQLGAQPVAIPIPEIKEVMGRGELDGVFTSPGGWSTQVIEFTPHAVQVPGLMYINYALVANKAWLDALPDDQRDALAGAGAQLTDQWVQMSEDDVAVINETISGGGTYRVLPDEEVARWRGRVDGISDRFYAEHPSLANELVNKGLLTQR